MKESFQFCIINGSNNGNVPIGDSDLARYRSQDISPPIPEELYKN